VPQSSVAETAPPEPGKKPADDQKPAEPLPPLAHAFYSAGWLLPPACQQTGSEHKILLLWSGREAGKRPWLDGGKSGTAVQVGPLPGPRHPEAARKTTSGRPTALKNLLVTATTNALTLVDAARTGLHLRLIHLLPCSAPHTQT